ncbi:hypothetical protein OHB01_12405 [Microbispora hainanensis]|uniref:hypothetical protein n=1 Tax=Microbispora hainanensis TaxID=568844 RepID=UPI002E2E671E|nr:hypothetical protein [Microbispora hainanensis]
MLAVQLAALLGGDQGNAGEGTEEALALLDGFDDVLVHGLARLADERAEAVAALAAAFAATPLGDRLAEAADAVVSGSITQEHLTALAGGRVALSGAVHDALLESLDTALGRERAEWPPTPGIPEAASDSGAQPAGRPAAEPSTQPAGRPAAEPAAQPAAQPAAPPASESAAQPAAQPAGQQVAQPAGRPAAQPAGNVLGGVRSWLRELAITGWRGVDHDLVSAADQVIEALLAAPGLRRLAVLIDGFAAELRASCPIGSAEHLPVRRWADLWTRALLLSQDGVLTGEPTGEPGPAAMVSGRLLVLGVDVHEHGTAVQFQVHAVLEPADGGTPRLVRTSVTAAKVDTIVGTALWKLPQRHKVLLAALADRRSIEIADVPLLDSGDLVWHDDRAFVSKPADPLATARLCLPGALAPAVPPLDRVPVRIAEPVLVEGYKVTKDGSFDLDGTLLAVDTERLPDCGPLTPKLVAASSVCVGLMRWDGGRWTLQPLAVQAKVKREAVVVATGDWALGPTDPKAAKAEARAADAVAVLQERAGRLLRR